jgi:hypothetical protein
VPLSSSSAGRGIAFLVGVEVMDTVIAKACSSPQTAEINADKRAPTLMKWVNIGMVEGVLFVGIAAWLDPSYSAAFLAGGGLAAAITYGQYLYAKNAGLKNGGAGTES